MYADNTDNLNIEVLNKRIPTFNYGFSDIKNKPPSNFTRQISEGPYN